MGFAILIVVLSLIAAVAGMAVLSGVLKERQDDGSWRVYRSGPLLAITVIWALLTGLMTVLASYHQIEAGHVGIVRTFGEISGQIEEGPNFLAPWKSSQTFDIRIQKAEFRGQRLNDDGRPDGDDKAALGRIEAASIETQDVFMDITLNWQVSPSAVQELVRNVGPNFFELLVPTRVLQHTKAEVVRHTAVEATQLREEIRQNIAATLQADLNAFSITVVSLQIDNIAYRPSFSDAIEAKQVATQDAQRAEELVKLKESEARQNIAQAAGEADAAIQTARGEAERLRVTAMGEADAIRTRADATAHANTVIAASLTADLIQFEALNHIDEVDLMLLPADGNFLLDPSGILRRNQPGQ